MESSPLTFEGLVLRPFHSADAPAFVTAVLESTDTVGRWMPWCKNTYSEREALEWFAVCEAAHSAGSAFDFGVFCQDTGEFLGGAGLNQIMQQHRFCNLGYWVRQSRQRQGIASRCLKALALHAFEKLLLHRVEIVVAVGNHASEALAVKAGALRECIARNRLYIHDQSVSAHVFSLVPGSSGG
ncbi:GNAT family N-acetyltransferase [Massilia sp. SR12]